MWENWHPLAAAQGWLSRSSLAKVTPAGCALPRRSSCEGLKQIPILVNRWDSQGLMDERVFAH